MKLKFEFEIMELGDEYVAVPIKEGSEEFRGVIKLNKSAVEIFKLLKKNTTETEIVEALTHEYASSEKEISEYVHKIIIDLYNNNILID